MQIRASWLESVVSKLKKKENQEWSLKNVDLCDGQLTFEHYCRQQFEV